MTGRHRAPDEDEPGWQDDYPTPRVPPEQPPGAPAPGWPTAWPDAKLQALVLSTPRR